MDWGDTRDLTRKSVYRGEQADEIGAQQLAQDIELGVAREGSFYEAGSAPWENQPLSHTTEVVKPIRDQMLIRGDWRNKYGSNRAPLTEAAVRRLSEATEGKVLPDEINAYAEALVDSPSIVSYSRTVVNKYWMTSRCICRRQRIPGTWT